jgi:hypothetical protein
MLRVSYLEKGHYVLDDLLSPVVILMVIFLVNGVVIHKKSYMLHVDIL